MPPHLFDLADAAYDAEPIRAACAELGTVAVNAEVLQLPLQIAFLAVMLYGVCDGHVAFDPGRTRNPWNCLDFESYEVWLNSADVTDTVIAAERAAEKRQCPNPKFQTPISPLLLRNRRLKLHFNCHDFVTISKSKSFRLSDDGCLWYNVNKIISGEMVSFALHESAVYRTP